MKPKMETQELLILADGRILTHNLTSAMAAVLRELNPEDEAMQQRADATDHEPAHELPART